MRDRLIELLIKGVGGSMKNEKIVVAQHPADIFTYFKWADLADHLLANGVIVPPCKVGDTVYFDVSGYHDSAEIDGIHIDETGISFTWVQYEVGVDITELWDEGEFSIDKIGKTVFLTREEAERALKEGGKG